LHEFSQYDDVASVSVGTLDFKKFETL